MDAIEVLSFSQLQDFLHMTYPFYARKIKEKQAMDCWVALGVFAKNRPIALVLTDFSDCAGLDCEGKFALLCSVFVEPEYRCQTLGTKLVKAMSLEVLKRGCKQMMLTYMTKNYCHLFLEKILDRCGWENPETKNFFLEFDASCISSPHFFEPPRLPLGFELFLFEELTSEERAVLQKARGILYPEELDPFLDEESFEPSNSYGLRYDRQVVGWMINHRVLSDTIRYTRLWTRNDLRKFGLGMTLIAKSLHQQFIQRNTFNNAIVVLSQKYPEMIRFAEKRLVAFSTCYYESKKAVKHLMTLS